MEIQFATQSYKSDSLPLSAQRTINAYAEIEPQGAKSRVAVFGVPGIDPFATVGTGPIRGGLDMNGIAYVVSGSSFYSIANDGAVQLLGAGISETGNVSMAGNGFEIIIVNGSLGYSYLVASNNFAQISDPDFLPANSVTNIDNIFAFDIKGTNQFQLSGILDGRTYDPFDRYSAEADSDFVQSVTNRKGNLIVFGTKTIEVWNHTGGSDFAFSRIQGVVIDKGILAPLAFVLEDEGVFYLGNDFIFYRLAGLQKQRVSTFALESEWRSYTMYDDAFCSVMTFQGHKFIYVTFPTANRTFCLDIASGLWHERMSYDLTGIETRWNMSCIIDCYGKLLVGNSVTNQVGLVNKNTHTEWGFPIVTTLVSPSIYNKGQMFAMPRFELDMDTGVGLTTGQGSDPQIMLDFSDDGGRNFTSPQLWNSMGAIGAYNTRLQWNGLGSAYERYIRVSITDPIRRVIHGARCPGLYFDPAE
jgi:Phage stabilisation protein